MERFGKGLFEFYPVKDINATGNFEITLMNTQPPKLLHSKQTQQGLQRCESPEERERLYKILDVFVEFMNK